MSYTDSEPGADWRADGLCRAEDPEDFYPVGSGPKAKARERHAKAVCFDCPVVAACRAWALESQEPHGVWGGLSEKERRSILQRNGIARARAARAPMPDSFEELWEQRTETTVDGHLVWTGYEPVKWRGNTYTPSQVGFRVDRGRPPVGRVLRSCGYDGCVLPAHFADNEEREQCGTQPGYRRHAREGTAACARCRQANTDADNRLRTTGTSKAVAA